MEREGLTRLTEAEGCILLRVRDMFTSTVHGLMADRCAVEDNKGGETCGKHQ